MRITGLRSIAVLAAIVSIGAIAAAPPQTPVSVLGDLSASLSNNNVSGALSVFDAQMPGYRTMERNLEAIAAQDDVASTIDVVSEEETAGVHKLDLDWYLQLTSRADSNQLERRRQRVRVEMRQIKGKWKITALEPVAIFDPLRVK